MPCSRKDPVFVQSLLYVLLVVLFFLKDESWRGFVLWMVRHLVLGLILIKHTSVMPMDLVFLQLHFVSCWASRRLCLVFDTAQERYRVEINSRPNFQARILYQCHPPHNSAIVSGLLEHQSVALSSYWDVLLWKVCMLGPLSSRLHHYMVENELKRMDYPIRQIPPSL